MTKKELIAFEPSDIQRVTFECKCGGSIAVAGGKQFHKKDGYTLRCPACNEQWPRTVPSDVYGKFLAVLSELLEAEAGQDVFTVRLEISSPSDLA